MYGSNLRTQIMIIDRNLETSTFSVDANPLKKKSVTPPARAGKPPFYTPSHSSSTSTVFLFSRSLVVVIYGKWLELIQPSVRSSFCWVDFSNVYLFTFCAQLDRSNLLYQCRSIYMCMYVCTVNRSIIEFANWQMVRFYCVNAK